jgi:phosphate transport system substrate-binding protein
VASKNVPGVCPEIPLERHAQVKNLQGKYKKWNHTLLAGHNPGVTLPDKPITVVHPTDGSGTKSLKENLTGLSAA